MFIPCFLCVCPLTHTVSHISISVMKLQAIDPFTALRIEIQLPVGEVVIGVH